MQLSVTAIFALLGLAAAAPSGEEKIKAKRAGFDIGECNGTSCYVNLVNSPCDRESCVGEGGGDGAACYVFQEYGESICPVGCTGEHCP